MGSVADLMMLSAVVVARNESTMIEACLRHLRFADEIVVVIDERSDDDTADVARRAGARVENARFETFSEARNLAMKLARGRWVLFVDADERVSSRLAGDVQRAVAGPPAGYRVRVENWFYGARVERSGYRERPVRLFPVEGVTFSGDIHETPVLPPGLPVRALGGPLLHLSHRSVVQNLRKTADYAEVQANEMLANGHAKVTRWSLVRTILHTLARHLVVGQGFRDGPAGFVESLYSGLFHSVGPHPIVGTPTGAVDRGALRDAGAIDPVTGIPSPAALGLTPGDVVLDIGCAGGVGTLALDRLGYRAIGVELLPGLLGELRASPETEGLPACQADATSLPMPAGSVKGVFLIEVLEHIPDTMAVLREVRRVLVEDGRACIAVPTGYTERVFHRLHPRYTANAEHVHVFSRQGLQTCLADAGLTVLDVQTTNLGPAVAWLAHAILRTDADPTGRVLRRGWIDIAVSRGLWILRRAPVVRSGLAAVERRVGKSWYFHLAPS